MRRLKAVLNKRLHGRTPHIGFKAPSGFAAADIRRFGYVFERDGFFIVFTDIGEHLLHADLRMDLNARVFSLRQILQMQKYLFKNTAQCALNRHFVTGTLFTHQAVNLLHAPVHLFVPTDFLPEQNKRQGVTLCNRLNIFAIDYVGFRCNRSAGKDDIRHQVGRIAGKLLDSMQRVSVHKYAVSRIQGNMLLPDLNVHNAACRRGEFKVGMPMQRSLPIGESRQFVAKIGNGKLGCIMVDLFAQLMIEYYRHNFSSEFVCFKIIIARFYAFFYLFHAKKRQVFLPLFILLSNINANAKGTATGCLLGVSAKDNSAIFLGSVKRKSV